MDQFFPDLLKRLFPKEGKALLAVSGGIDSMCMAAAAHEADLPFDVAHCNFSLRGEDSDADEALVCSWCFDNDIFCHVARFDTMAYARKNGISIEMAAREQRYAWFARLCKARGYSAVFVAHNANDNAETLLLNLVRGSGLRGICGMTEVSTQVIEGQTLTIIRPFLEVSRQLIREFAEEAGVPFREDKTNADVAYKRNRLRLRVMPELEEMNPSVLKTLASGMAHFREVAGVADSYYEAFLKKVGANADYPTVPVADLVADPHWKYLVYRLMEPFGFSSSDIGDVVALLSSGNPIAGKLFTSGDVIACFSSDEFIITRATAPWSTVEVPGPGVYKCGKYSVAVSLTDKADFSEGVINLDADKVPFPLKLRPWEDGDFMCPLGMGGKRRKLSDIFTSLRVPGPLKSAQVLVQYPFLKKHIAAIPAFGKIDDALKLEPGSTRVLRLQIREDAL